MTGVTPLTREGGKQVYRIAFTFKGVQCREIIALAHNRSHQLHCERLKAEIDGQIEKGSFVYSDYFPDSRRAALFGHGGKSRTIRKALEAYRDRTKATLEASTWNCYRRDINNILIPWCGDMKISAFRSADLRAWTGLQSVGLKRIRNILLPLRAVFAEAMEDGDIKINPLASLRLSKLVPIDKRTSDFEPEPYTVDELLTLLSNLAEPERWTFQLWAYTGLRTGEIIGLRWPRVDLEAKSLRVTETTTEGEDKPRAKTKAGIRAVTLLPSAIEALEHMRAFTQLGGDRVNANTRGKLDDRRWHANRLDAIWKKAHQGTGIAARPPYQLRHTFASQLLSQGENPAYIAKLLGHKTIEMVTRSYGRWISEGEKLGFDRPPRRYGMEPLWAASTCVKNG